MTDFSFRAVGVALQPGAIREGDTILVRPGAESPVLLIRRLPANYGAILKLFEDGLLTSLDLSSEDAESELCRLVVSHSPPPNPRALPDRQRLG